MATALAADPTNAALHRMAARAHHVADEPGQAAEAARRSLGLEITSEGFHLLGASQRAIGDDLGSQDSYRRAMSLAPEAPELRVGLALTLVTPVMDADPPPPDRAERLAEARRLCEEASALGPDRATVPYTRGVVEVAAGDLPGAARELERALELDPELAAAHRVLGTVRAQQGMARLASRHLAAAGRLDPGDPHALSLLRRLVRPMTRRARRRGRADTGRVVPAAQRIIEADLRLRESPPTEW